MKSLAIASALMIATAAGAAAPVAPPAAPTAAVAKPQPTPVPTRVPGVSDAGNAILAKAQTASDPQLQAAGKQLKVTHDQLVSAVMAPMIDVDRVEAALRAQEAAQAQMRTRSNDRLLAVLKQLPSDDRGTFLRALLLARQPRPAGSAPVSPQP